MNDLSQFDKEELVRMLHEAESILSARAICDGPRWHWVARARTILRKLGINELGPAIPPRFGDGPASWGKD